VALFAGAAGAAGVVQVNFRPYFNADVVLNTSGAGLDEDMGTIEGLWAFATDSAGATSSCDGPWLPDDGFFGGNAAHPEAQLGYSNDDDGFNVWQTFDEAGEVTVQVPNLAYDTLYLYATGAYQTFLTVTLNYTTGGPEAFAGIAYPSWFDEPPTNFFNLVDGLDRARPDLGGVTCEDVDDPGIVGLPIPVDPERILDTLTLTRTDDDQGMLNVFGATLRLARTVYDYDLSAHFNADLVANAPSGCSGIASYDHVHDAFDENGHLPTATLAGCIGGGAGLPDDGIFPGTGNHPPFALAFANADSGLNAYRRPPGLGHATFVVDVTDAAVDQVHFFGGGGGGYTVLGLELFYTDATSQVIGGGLILDGILADGNETEPTSYQLVDGMKLHETCGAGCWSTTIAADAALFGIPVAANPAKVLDEIEITAYDPTGGPVPQSTLGLLGISGVRSVDFYLYMDDFETAGLTGWSLQNPAP
jgi:hypothetical protein